MFQDITVDELLELQNKRELTLVDVRSPSEYEESTVPGALNIPLFNDAERAEIGTLYKQVSVQAAKDRGLEIVSAKLPSFIKTFEQIGPRKAVFCWRGGMRSRTTATVLSLMGIRVYRLSGGIRAYRQWVLQTLEGMELRMPAYVVHGYTGTGKTVMLRRLRDQGYPVLDLEGLAGHRGSIFGQIGLRANNQKTFESLLVHDLLELQDAPYVLMEAESKRVGKVVLPEFVIAGKERGIQLTVELPVEERVRHILEDYRPWEHQEECLKAFEYIERRIHTPVAHEIRGHLQEERYADAVRLLLEHYYDPRYEHAALQYESQQIVIRESSIEAAVEALKKHLPPLDR